MPPSNPYGPKFSQFHAVFVKFAKIVRGRPLPEDWRPLLREILDPPLVLITKPSINQLDLLVALNKSHCAYISLLS